VRTISFGSRFKKDFKRESRGLYAKTLVPDLEAATEILRADGPLPARYADHAFSGRWTGNRDCHIKPDLVLIYNKRDGQRPEDGMLQLVRLGSHSELSL
jgi:mRNA interferase YafQ